MAGQLEGTLFDVQAAQRKLQQINQGTYRHPTLDHKMSARDVAQAARGASRALQALSSQVSCACFTQQLCSQGRIQKHAS